jgi:hypothetical protein
MKLAEPTDLAYPGVGFEDLDLLNRLDHHGPQERM